MSWLSRPERLRPKLAPGEEIVAATEATASGTGRTIGVAATIGALVGLLYATTGDPTSWWSSTALGAFVGIAAGYGWAWVLARRSGGPGAVSVVVVMTNRRLAILRRSASLRSQPLRSLDLEDIVQVSTHPAPVGQYMRVQFHTKDEIVAVFASSHHDFAALHREHTNAQRVD